MKKISKIILVDLIVLSFMSLVGCSELITWQTKYPDNWVEEVIEEYIEDLTQTELDLTPFTGEERQEF